MQRVFSYRQGDRAEYLAHYILSAIAITVPVPRQEDVGSDFHCSLLRRTEQNLRPYLPFDIQIKSCGQKVKKEGVPFGGTTDTGKWRQHEIDQLCQTDTPFLIGLVDLKEQWIDIFSTLTRYFAVCRWRNKVANARQINLMPYEPQSCDDLGDGTETELAELPGMPRNLWKLPLGQPICRISIEDSEDADKCEEIKTLLERYLRMDQENGVFARIGLGYFNWPVKIQTDQPLAAEAFGFVPRANGTVDYNKQLLVAGKIAASLLCSYKVSGEKAAIKAWEPVLAELPIKNEPQPVQNAIKEALEYANS